MEKISQTQILSGIIVRNEIRQRLAKKVSALSLNPKLVIIQVGEREDSTVYITQKKKFGESIGVFVEHKKFVDSMSEAELIEEIEKCNTDTTVTAVIVQLPLPAHIPTSVLEQISPQKDVDCLTEFHRKKLSEGDEYSAPATARAVVALLMYYHVDLDGVRATIVGRSALVGDPVAHLLRIRGAHVFVVHRGTENPRELTRTAQVLVVACGVPKLIDSSWIDPNKKTVVIDVGIHRTANGLVGDVDFPSVEPLVSAISPVPGGVGPVTVACLFEHLVYMYQGNL